jgi:hypothetical protein
MEETTWEIWALIKMAFKWILEETAGDLAYWLRLTHNMVQW